MSPKWLQPERSESRLDELYLSVRTLIPALPGYNHVAFAGWQTIQTLLERTPGLHPDHRHWARASMQSEGIVFDTARCGSQTRSERRADLRFYEPEVAGSGRLVPVPAFSAQDLNAQTVLVIVGNTVNNLVRLERESALLDREVFAHLPPGTRIVYLQDTLEYFTYALAETRKVNASGGRHVPERACIIARHLFGEKIAAGGIRVDSNGQVRGERLPLDVLRRNMRTNVIGLCWGGTLYAGVLSQVRSDMQQLGYSAEEVREGMQQSFALMVGSATQSQPQEAFGTTVSLLSRNDLMVRSRIRTRALFSPGSGAGTFPRRVDIDATQALVLGHIPRIVTEQTASGETVPWLRSTSGKPAFSMNGHDTALYVRNLFAEFGPAPGDALANAIGNESLQSKEALFDSSWREDGRSP